MPRALATSIGAIYARYSTRYQHSIADQVRGCLEAAVQQGIFIPREHIFFDLAVRGGKVRRPGFASMKEVLARKTIQVLLILTTNRLFRKMYRSLQFIEEEVVARGFRCQFVRSGVDTADEKRWRMLLNNFASIDEFVVTMYAENIRVAHEGLFRLKLVFGTISFGYRGKEVPGVLTKDKKPRREYEVDPETAEWVRKIFCWYVEDGLAIAEIVRRLNDDPDSPLGPRAISGRWTRTAVTLLLANPRYRGFWAYGTTQAVWQVTGDYVRQIERAKPLAEAQFEELRIIDDATWYAASSRLVSTKGKNGGRRPTDGDTKSRPKLLNGVFFCSGHPEQQLNVSGTYGKMMVCPVCQGLPVEKRPLFTQLNRVLALQRTCARLAELIRPDVALVADIIAACRREAEAAQQPDPARMESLRRQIEKLTQGIQFVMANSGDTDADRQESGIQLRRLRTERATAQTDYADLQAAKERPMTVPSETEVTELLEDMGKLLCDAASEGHVDDGGQARLVIELLTGGRIALEQCGERRSHRGWLRGRFTVRLLEVIPGKILGVKPAVLESDTEVVIDYLNPTKAEQRADRVKELVDKGMLMKAIEKQLGLPRNSGRKALVAWHVQRGLEPPVDGRQRWSTLEVKFASPCPHKAIADDVKRFMDKDWLLQDIARELGCNRDLVTKAKNHWYRSRGLKPPDGRTRYKELGRNSERPSNSDQTEQPPSAGPPA